MSKLIAALFQLFAYVTGIAGEIWKYQQFGWYVLLAIGILACFLGFYVYRFYVSGMLFGAVTILICTLMNPSSNWGAVVTCFSVVGVILAFLSYRWAHLDAYIFSCVATGLMGWVLFGNAVGACCMAAAAFVIIRTFPVIGICMISSIAGAWILAEMMGSNLASGIGIAVAGIFLQMIMSRKQKLFSSPVPEKVSLWMAERKGGA